MVSSICSPCSSLNKPRRIFVFLLSRTMNECLTGDVPLTQRSLPESFVKNAFCVEPAGMGVSDIFAIIPRGNAASYFNLYRDPAITPEVLTSSCGNRHNHWYFPRPCFSCMILTPL